MKKPHYVKELFSNQVWQGLNFLSKAAFLLLLTPLMLAQWGKEEYGVFGLASSLIVSLAIIDGGVRDATRMKLCAAIEKNDEEGFAEAWLHGLASFGLVALIVSIGALSLAWNGDFGEWLKIEPEDNWVIAITVVFTSISMLSFLALEPLAARNQLSKIKCSNTIGALVAIPCVGAVVYLHGSVLSAMSIYFVCLLTPNVILIISNQLHKLLTRERFFRIRFFDIVHTFRTSWWLYFSTLVSITRTHALSFVISHISGPAAVANFYIYLRLSELISTLGGTSSETLVASMASTPDVKEKATSFHQALNYGIIFCSYSSMTVAFAGIWGITLIFHKNLDVTLVTTSGIALLGLANAFISFVYHAAIGVHKVRAASLCNGFAALFTCVGCILFQGKYGVEATLLVSAFSAICLIPAAVTISKEIQQNFYESWVSPIIKSSVYWGVAAACMSAAYFSKSLVLLLISVGFAFLMFVLEWKKQHAHPASQTTE